MPALVDDGVLVTESAAIVLYLTDEFPAAKLGPKVGDPLRGAYLSWLAYYAGVAEPVVTIGFAGLADHPHLHALVPRHRAGWSARPRARCDAGPYLLGPSASPARICSSRASPNGRVTRCPPIRPVDAWLARVNARPALARAHGARRRLTRPPRSRAGPSPRSPSRRLALEVALDVLVGERGGLHGVLVGVGGNLDLVAALAVHLHRERDGRPRPAAPGSATGQGA